MLNDQVNVLCKQYSKNGCSYKKCPLFGICKLVDISPTKLSPDENYKLWCEAMNEAAKKAMEVAQK